MSNIHQLHISGPTEAQTITLTIGSHIIGRQAADILLEHPIVSRRHAQLDCADEACTLMDLKSSNGTKVNEQVLPPNEPMILNDGDTIVMGPFTLRYKQTVVAEPKPEPEPVSETPVAPPPKPKAKQTAVPPTPPPPPSSPTGTTSADGYTPPPGLTLTQSRYLQYLPDIYHTDFMARFLALFESIYGPIEWTVNNFDLFLHPQTAPSGFLPWLANWFDLTFDNSWTEAQQRQLLTDIHEIYERRGTKWALSRILEIYTKHKPEIEDTDNKLAPFTFTVTIPLSPGAVNQSLIEQLINQHKPAYTNYTLHFNP